MKGSDLIKLIKNNKLEEYDIGVIFNDGYSIFPNIRRVNIVGLADIGHSSKVAYLDAELDE